MAIVIKIAGFKSDGAETKIYGDALVNEGTLLLHDYSNTGCLRGFDVSNGAPVADLAALVSKDKLGIDNASIMNTEGAPSELTLTPGRGIDLEYLRSISSASNHRGMDLGTDLPQYLYDNQPKTLLTYWVRARLAAGGIVFLTTGEPSFNFLVGALSPSIFQGRVANGTSGGASIDAEYKLVQYSVEFNQVGSPLRIYVNGIYSADGGSNATGFDAGFEKLLIGSRASNPNAVDAFLYRLMIVDLDKSEYTAAEIVQKDWEYCNGIGEYAGLPTKRPFIDEL